MMSSLGLDLEAVVRVTELFFPNVVAHVILIGAVMIDSCIHKANDTQVPLLWYLYCCWCSAMRMHMFILLYVCESLSFGFLLSVFMVLLRDNFNRAPVIPCSRVQKT